MKLKKLLIANRGEVAVRILRAAGLLHIPTVAVYSADDSRCLHVRRADSAIELAGRNLTDKVVGFLCASGGDRSYMSVMAVANSLMLDFRTIIVPRFVYAAGDDIPDGEEVGSADQLVAHAAGFDLAGPADDGRDPVTSLPLVPLDPAPGSGPGALRWTTRGRPTGRARRRRDPRRRSPSHRT